MTKTIDPQHAAELYELLPYKRGAIFGHQDDANGAYGWILRGSFPIRTSDEHECFWLVLEDAVGDTWGIEYDIWPRHGRDALPWRGTRHPVPLTRLYPHTVTRTEYRTVAP